MTNIDKKPFYKRPLGCIITLAGGLIVFLVLATLIGIWAAGACSPGIAANVLKNKAGATLTTDENDNNLFAGRVHLKNITLTNPSRFSEQRFLEINEIKAQVELASFLSDRYVIPEVILDIKSLTFVGKGRSILDSAEDNNVMDFKKAFESGETAQTPEPEKAPEPQTPATPVRFQIAKLVVKLDQLRAVMDENAGKPLLEKSGVLSLEFTDVTDENIKEKVYDKIDSVFRQSGLGIAVMGSLNAFASDAKKQLDAAAQSAQEKAGEAVNKANEKAGEKINETGQKAVDALGGFLGGNKK